jgi:hypothetical protein
MNEVFANAYGIGNAGRCALVWYPDVRLGSKADNPAPFFSYRYATHRD